MTEPDFTEPSYRGPAMIYYRYFEDVERWVKVVVAMSVSDAFVLTVYTERDI